MEANNFASDAALARRGAIDAPSFDNLAPDTADWPQSMFRFLAVKVLLCTQCHSFDSVRCIRNRTGGRPVLTCGHCFFQARDSSLDKENLGPDKALPSDSDSDFQVGPECSSACFSEGLLLRLLQFKLLPSLLLA